MYYGRNKSTVCILLWFFIVLKSFESLRVDAKERGKTVVQLVVGDLHNVFKYFRG